MNPQAPSTDYHDYVIKDGRFIGAFEQMYRDCTDPWHQDTVESVSEDVALAMLSRHTYRTILDLGCGKGRFTHRLSQATAASVIALDISATAIQTALSRYPDIRFMTAEIPPLPFPAHSFDLVVAAELLWYVLPRMPELFSEIDRILLPAGHLLILQNFYPPGQQRYGTEVMETPQDLLQRLPFPPLHQAEVDRFSNYKWVALCEKGLEDGRSAKS